MKNELIKLTEQFFKSLKCEVMWKDKVLFIDKVPADFEKFYGKKSPFNFVFEKEYLNEDTELITRGSSLIKIIADYLDNRAQTTLLKIVFKIDLKEELKEKIDFNDYEIINLLEKNHNDYIYRFTFLSVLQYLNEKEQIITPIYVHDKSILDNFSIEDYQSDVGKKDEVKIDDVKEHYLVAKEKLKILLQPNISSVGKILDESLENELKRLGAHYMNQIGEIYNEIQENEKKITELTSKLSGKSSEENKKIFLEKIEKLKQNADNLKKSEDFVRFEKEKELSMNDEKNKHSLNISNNLMNTTIIYYPIISIRASVKRKKDRISKEIKMEYNPLTKKLSSLFCEGCGKEIKEINICSSNHLSCKDCIEKCPSCFNILCKNCKKSICNICSAEMCNKCESVCIKCSKPVCKSHSCKDFLSGKDLCTNCSEYCSCCSRFSPKTNFKRCEICKSNVCSSCLRTKIIAGKTKTACVNCIGR